jgi:hypothetical protein
MWTPANRLTFRQIGPLIDQTGNYEAEQEQMMRTTGIDLDPNSYLVKLLIGAVDSSYDTKGTSKIERP